MGINKSVSESITEDNNTVSGKSIIVINKSILLSYLDVAFKFSNFLIHSSINIIIVHIYTNIFYIYFHVIIL